MRRCDIRRGMGAEDLAQAIRDHLHFTLARPEMLASRNEWYIALSCALRDRMFNDWIKFLQHLYRSKFKIVSYPHRLLSGLHGGTQKTCLHGTEYV